MVKLIKHVFQNILRKIFKIYQFIFTITLLLSSMNNSKFLFPRDFFNKIGRPKAQENKQLSLHYPRTLCPKCRAHDSGKEFKCEKLQDRETVPYLLYLAQDLWGELDSARILHLHNEWSPWQWTKISTSSIYQQVPIS